MWWFPPRPGSSPSAPRRVLWTQVWKALKVVLPPALAEHLDREALRAALHPARTTPLPPGCGFQHSPPSNCQVEPAFTAPTALAWAFSDPCPTCGHSALRSNGMRFHVLAAQPRVCSGKLRPPGRVWGCCRSGSSPLSCASSGCLEEWFHQGESLFVLLSSPGVYNGHQGATPSQLLRQWSP